MKKLKKLYFEHDFDARNSTTIKKIAKEIGLAGVGVYWILIEKLYEKNGVIDNEDVELLAWDFREDVSIFEGVIKIAFEKDGNKIKSKGVIKRIEERETASKSKSEKARESANKRWGGKREAPVPEWMTEKKEIETEKTYTDEEAKNLVEKVFDTATKKKGK